MTVLLRHLLAFALVITVQSKHESPLPCTSHLTPLFEGAKRAVTALLMVLKRRFQRSLSRVQQRVSQWMRPTSRSLFVGTLTDLARTRADLIAENALLRQQLIILHRQVKRPTCTRTDRLLLVILARAVRNWKQALFIVQPDTLLGWHRQAFRWFWRRRSKAASRHPKIAPETVSLIKTMARDNRLWGAERIRGELLKLNIYVSKRTIQKYMRQERVRPTSQTWSCFLHNHAHEIWACDFLPVTDLFFRSLFAFFIIELQSRKVVHVGVTRHPTDAWVAQQLREATPFGQAPRFLIRDNDSKFGPLFARVADSSDIKDSSSRFPNRLPPVYQPRPGMVRSWPCPSWAAYIMITAELPERLRPKTNANAKPFHRVAGRSVRILLCSAVSRGLFSRSLA